jgi:hypothetical protein
LTGEGVVGIEAMIVPNGRIASPPPLPADGAALNRQGFAGAGNFLPEAGGFE